jgi:hypothetical protein
LLENWTQGFYCGIQQYYIIMPGFMKVMDPESFGGCRYTLYYRLCYG